MDLHQRAIPAIDGLADLMLWQRPAEQPSGFVGAHIDAASAHGHAEILVPVGAMKGMTLRGEEKRPGNAGELVIVCIGEQVAIAHMLVRHLVQNAEVTLGRLRRKTIRPARTVQNTG